MVPRSVVSWVALSLFLTFPALSGCEEESVDTSGGTPLAGRGGTGASSGAGGNSAGSSAGGSGGSGGSEPGGAGGQSTAGSGGSSAGSGGGGGSGGVGAGGSAGTGGGSGGVGGSAGGTGGGSGGTGGGSGGSGGLPAINPESVELCNLVNEYRKENGLPAIPLSTALMTVAAYHVQDLSQNPGIAESPCNLHSWSDNPPLWSGCCYTSDHAKAQCMWDKPMEITASWGANQYSGSGFENAAAGVSSPSQALSSWKGSSAHNAVILNQGMWNQPWLALGCALEGGYGALWFGHQTDPQPYQP